ncbi:hypothetical protein LR48_Vigan10g235200 [Vigna angularis]|uniref:GRF-type domain-containing protein n=1 Tax=Phaseolus angularis TaxID=3914 RepID=A0A0L9VN44_PHAAN|nr:hypothetical protein LR48_Vigan10g235200 [Vigna angularis]
MKGLLSCSEMKGESGGNGWTRRSTGSSKSQSCESSSRLPSKLCGCGETLLVLKATTVKNKGRLFYRCRNWASNSSCNYFEWHDEGVSEAEGSYERKHEELQMCLENEKLVLDLRKKNEKLKRKLEEEKKVVKMMLLLFVLSWALTIFFCIMFLLKMNCN